MCDGCWFKLKTRYLSHSTGRVSHCNIIPTRTFNTVNLNTFFTVQLQELSSTAVVRFCLNVKQHITIFKVSSPKFRADLPLLKPNLPAKTQGVYICSTLLHLYGAGGLVDRILDLCSGDCALILLSVHVATLIIC